MRLKKLNKLLEILGNDDNFFGFWVEPETYFSIIVVKDGKEEIGKVVKSFMKKKFEVIFVEEFDGKYDKEKLVRLL